MRVGDVAKYQDSDGSIKTVYITSGDYNIGGRISNFWYFKVINADGTLSDEEGCDYNNGPFTIIDESAYEIKTEIKFK
jgi:hypothetical protein